jgi:hypothetical protein
MDGRRGDLWKGVHPMRIFPWRRPGRRAQRAELERIVRRRVLGEPAPGSSEVTGRPISSPCPDQPLEGAAVDSRVLSTPANAAVE